MLSEKIKDRGFGYLRTPTVKVVVKAVLRVWDQDRLARNASVFQFFREKMHVFRPNELISAALN